MNILTPKYWKPIFVNKKDNRYDGIEFENLIEVILNRGFAGKWERTQITHDGGRDLVRSEIDGEEKWAECKIRKEKLTTFDISKTLVMAVNNKIKQILVFSYSPLVPSAIMHLSDFANRTNKAILVIDDNNLERLILKHLDESGFKRFFPSFDNVYELQPISDLLIDRLISNDIGLSRYQFNNYDEDRERHITAITSIGKYYLYEFYFTSNLDVKSDIVIDFSNFYASKSNNNIVDILNLEQYLKDNGQWKLLPSKKARKQNKNTYTREVLPYEVFNIRLYFQPIDRHDTLPFVTLTYNDNKYSSKPLEIEVRKNIITPEFIGGNLIKLLDQIEEDHSVAGRSKFYLIAGSSGVGKSRFVYEVIGKLLKYNYNIYSISGSTDNRMSNFPYFLIELLTLIFKIPSPYIAGKDVDMVAMFTEDNPDHKVSDTVCKIILQCLRNHLFSHSEIDNEILPFIHKELTRTKSVLLVDDVQNLDENSIHLLSELIKIINTTSLCSIFYIYNTETLNHTSPAGYLYHTLVSENTIIINDFTIDHVEQFINSTIRLEGGNPFSMAYKQLYNSIVECIPHRPFYLLQFAFALDQKGIVKWNNNYMYIYDIEKLDYLLNSLSDREISILDIRFEHLTAPYIAAIHLLKHTGSLNITMLRTFFSKIITPVIMQNLIKWNFIKEENGRVTFVHSLMEKYVLDKELKIKYYHKKKTMSIFNDNVRKQYPLANFSLLPSVELFDDVVNTMEQNCSTTDRNAFYADCILKFIYIKSDISPDRYVCNIDNLAVLSSKNNKLHYIEILRIFYNNLSNYIPIDEIRARKYIEIIREYGSFLTVYNEFDTSIKVLREGIARLDKLNLKEKLHNELKSRLINRIGVSYKQCRNLSKASENIISALHLAEKSDSIVMQALSYIDLGYISYGVKSENDAVLTNWDKAVKLHEESNAENGGVFDRDTSLACQLTNMLTIGIRGNHKNASILATQFKEKAICEASAFYELQGIRAEIFFDFMHDCTSKHIEVNLDKLIVLSTRYKIYKFYVFAYHLKALFYIKGNEPNLAAKEFNTILDLVDNESFKNNVSIEMWFLLNDLKTFYSKYETEDIKPRDSFKIKNLEKRLYGLHFPCITDSLYYDGDYCLTLP